MVLILAGEFTVNMISWTTITDTIRTSPLNHKVWDHAMEDKPVVKALLRKVNEVLYCFWGIFFKKPDLHDALLCVDFRRSHTKYLILGRNLAGDIHYGSVYLQSR